MNHAYDLTELKLAELKNRFEYHKPTEEQTKRYEYIRGEILTLAQILCGQCPDSGELTAALGHLDAVLFYSNAAIARNEKQ